MALQKKNIYKPVIKRFVLIIFLFVVSNKLQSQNNHQYLTKRPYAVVLGTTQDGGYPQAGCIKSCCSSLWKNSDHSKMVSSIGLVSDSKNSWIIDATPDFPRQYHILKDKHKTSIKGIFLTHAHMGHYSGLLHLGREVMGRKKMDVFAMSRMKSFLEENAPWNQLVELENIILNKIFPDQEIQIDQSIIIEPILVPHRDEFSETIAFKIMGENKSLVYIPDIDKWNIWERDILKIIMNNDYILIDGTFFDSNEIPNRDMTEIPHPFISESIELFLDLNRYNRNKVFFIHLNHTNPVIKNNSAAYNKVIKNGFNVAQEGQRFNL